MRPKLLLRVAAIIMLLHVVGHTIGHSGWKNAAEPEKKEVISQMTDHRFPFMGTVRSMGDYYDGYGYACTLALLLIASLLWIVSTSDSALARNIILVISICLLFWGVDELIYFFPMAASFTLISATLTWISFFKIKAPAP